MYDIINSVMSTLEGEPDILQDCSPAGNDSGISEGQHLSHSPGRDFASSPQSSDVVQVDHNYSLHLDCHALESLLCNMAEGGFSAELGKWCAWLVLPWLQAEKQSHTGILPGGARQQWREPS